MTDADLPALTSSEKNEAMFCHLAAFAGYLVLIGWLVGPLIIWMMKKDDSAFVDYHGRESLNFQISIMIYWIPVIALCFILIGFLLVPCLILFHFIAVIIAAIRANDGKHFRYPLCIRFF